ncbi:MAG: TonB-dependent receptor [Acidobacteriota bacterium]|nr:TonB-dependent receptor [Acidobacteriota bacterium]
MTDSTGAVVASAEVVVTNLATGVTVRGVTDAGGSYAFTSLRPGDYKVVISKPGFKNFQMSSVHVENGQLLQEKASLEITSVGISVDVVGRLQGVTEQPTQQDVFESNQQLRVLDRQQIESTGPVAGSAQIIALTPGANVTGYGNTGATKNTIGVNGVSQGWGGYGGYSGGGALAITFDGVPVADPATSLWQSPTIPEQFMIQNANVTYGPGDATTRWYNNIGGMVEFTPVQPSAHPHADFSASYGNYNQKDFAANLTSGIFHGWSAVVAAGVGSGDDFRNAPDGFKNPGKDVAFFGKGIKSYQENSFEIGGYYAHGAGYRSQVIPTVANPLITMDGTSTGAQYSQQTSGYYSTLPYASYEKYDTNEMGLVYGREHVTVDPTISVDNLTWFMHIARSHQRTNDVYNLGPQQMEWNSPYSDTVGNKLLVTKRLPFNTITVGGYYISELYNSRNNFFNTADGGSKRTVNIGGKIRSSNFDQADFAILAQDDIRFNSILTITPSIRYVGFRTGYGSSAQEDFNLAPGVILSSHCAATGASTPGNAKNQGSDCAGLENRSGMEPAVNATVRAMPWLSVYGGFMESLRAPQMGGGGGLFQSVDPASYHLSRQTYYQAGFKIHHEGKGVLNSMLITGAFYHQNWANQEIDTTLANGDTVSANGASVYKGFNASFDDDPIASLHLFANMNLETATYTNYVTVLPLGSSQPQQSFNGLHVPYVPSSTFNAGAYYDYRINRDLQVRPMLSLQYLGSQYIFNNNGVDSAGNQFPQPSNQTMPAYATINAGVKVPYKFLEFNVNAQNLANSKYLIYEYISAGGYYGTAGNGTAQQGAGYILAYPGAPITVQGGLTAHF